MVKQLGGRGSGARRFGWAYAGIVAADLAVLGFGGPDGLRWATKPCIAAALAAWCLYRRLHRQRGGALFLAGLVCAWLGDVLLLGTATAWFLAGLCAFLLAHLAYAASFWQLGRGVAATTRNLATTWLFGLLLALYGGRFLRLLEPGLDGLFVPVLAYLAAISLMAILAVRLRGRIPTPAWRLLAGGALLFVLSDSLLAYDRFRAPFAGAAVWVMASYALAQACLAAGMLRSAAPPADAATASA